MPKNLQNERMWPKNPLSQASFEEQLDLIRKEQIPAKPQFMRWRLLRGLGIEEPKAKAQNAVLLGCWALFLEPDATRNYFTLMKRLGIDYTYFDEEMCCGIGPVERAKGDEREKAERAAKEFMASNLEKVEKAGAKNAIYLCLWCAHLAKKFFPDSPIGQMHYPDILLERLSKEKLRLESPRVIGYYEGCHKRSKDWAPGVTLEWPKYRDVLHNIEGLKVVDMPDHLCCTAVPGRIIEAAQKLSLDTIVCSCLGCQARLRYTSKSSGVRVQYYPDLLLEALAPCP
ncbi:MAG: (Fe-S)-binding protein [Chloroflexota bacterium]|nr:(Fe-S)-binding protein [Chloroflexota bacterium]